MFFSVVVPVYQAESSIQICLESLCGQRLSDFEVILVDDGSTDRSGEICRQFASVDPRFHYIFKENGGPSSARNMGLNCAKGEFIVFLDSDDQYRDTYLESFHRLIMDNRQFDSFWCGYETIAKTVKRSGTDGIIPGKEKVLTFNRNELMTLHQRVLLSPLWNKAFRRSIIEDKNLRMNTDLSLGEDILFNLAYLDCCPNPQILLWNWPEYRYYSISDESLSNRFRPDLDEIFCHLRTEMRSSLEKWDAPDEQFVKYQTMVFYMLVQVMKNYDNPACTLSKAEKKQAIREVLTSEEFQTALLNGKITIHSMIRMAYRLKNPALIHVMERLAAIKRKIC